MEQDFMVELLGSTVVSLKIYFVAWLFGTFIGILVSYGTWHLSERFSGKAYLILTGMSFVPVTILIPYFIRVFGLNGFVYPLLAMPVALITFSSMYEAFQHSNRHRCTLILNYQQPKEAYFWRVVFRESMPSLKSAARQTLSICFAIFIALDFFVEYWNGLGGLVQKYYSRLAFDSINYYKMLSAIVVTGAVGVLQVYINNSVFNRWTEFRRHY